MVKSKRKAKNHTLTIQRENKERRIDKSVKLSTVGIEKKRIRIMNRLKTFKCKFDNTMSLNQLRKLLNPYVKSTDTVKKRKWEEFKENLLTIRREM